MTAQPKKEKLKKESASAEEEKKEPKLPYWIGKWKELDNYQCKFCPYSILDKDKAEEHYQTRHAPPPPQPQPSGPVLFDRFGNVVEKEK